MYARLNVPPEAHASAGANSWPGRVSVIIPCWNAVNVIERAINSVRRQTRAPNEIILIDDASTDATYEKLQSIASTDPSRMKVIGLNQNGGPGIARNAGWDAATGDYIAFLDADDAWHCRKLEISGHDTLVADPSASEQPLPSAISVSAVGLSRLLTKNPFPTRTVVVRRDLPMRFEGRSTSEDFLLWMEIIGSGAVGVHLSCALAYSFRPEFSPGGYSGDLWTHEKRELNALRRARDKNVMGPLMYAAASCWSVAKFGRRSLVRRLR